MNRRSGAVRQGLRLALACCLCACNISARETELQKAVKAHDVEAVRRLIASDASIGASFGDVDSPYELALSNLSPSEPATVEVLRLVLTRMDAAVQSGEGTIGITRPRPRPADQFFRSDRANAPSGSGGSAVEIAARRCSAEGVQALVEHGLTVRSDYVSDALVAAAGSGCLPVLRVLLDAGADVNRPDRVSDTALRMARRVRSGEGAAFLLGRGARGPKAGTETNATRKKVENILGSIIAPGAGANPEDAPGLWMEGADILRHPAGQAAAQQGVRSAAIETGSVLFVKGGTAELHVVVLPAAGAGGPAPPVAEVRKHTLILQDGTWMFSVGD